MSNRELHSRKCGKVKNRSEIMFPENFCKVVANAFLVNCKQFTLSLSKGNLFEILFFAIGKIVDNDNRMSTRDEAINKMGADEARPAGYQIRFLDLFNCHCAVFVWISFC